MESMVPGNSRALSRACYKVTRMHRVELWLNILNEVDVFCRLGLIIGKLKFIASKYKT